MERKRGYRLSYQLCSFESFIQGAVVVYLGHKMITIISTLQMLFINKGQLLGTYFNKRE